MRLFSTEQVSKYHPDKYADQISDAILDACLAQDPRSHVGCEVMVKDNTIVLGGEITTGAVVDYEAVARRVANKLGYQCDSVINIIGKQSQEIKNAVREEEQTGAGDQGMMVGFACDETPSFLPFAFDLANRIIRAIESDVEENPTSILRGDAKTQITTDLDSPQNMAAIQTIVISVCHKQGYGIEEVQTYIKSLLQFSKIFVSERTRMLINPAGTWNVGGPTADCGLTGRKIVCDQYGGFTPVGGGAFSGKDPTKVDRSAAYAARSLAVRIIKHWGAKQCTVQLAYAIGVSLPVSINISTGDRFLDKRIMAGIDPSDFTPRKIIKRLDLTKVQYERLSEGCHYRANIW